jgi:hypothetical protein
MRALGARPRAAVFPRDIASVDAAELTATSLDVDDADGVALSLAADVVLRPHVLVVIANERAYSRLSRGRRQLLARAAHEAVAAAVERIGAQDEAALARLCERGLALVETSSGELAEFQHAVLPVVNQLALDPLTRELFDEINRMRQTTAADALRCVGPVPRQRESSTVPLEGTWEWSVTKAELRAAGETEAGIANNAGRWRLVVDNGRFELRGLDAGDVYRGILVVRGDRIAVRLDGAHSAVPTWQYTWSLYRDRLLLSPVEGAAAAPQVVAKPLVRVD